ncbi:succinate dehydrogenase subunit 7B, mitochondrial-like isoform X1 [Wolffia australiana]
MSSLFSKSNLFSSLRGIPQQGPLPVELFSRRGFHVEPGAREKALLEDDPALRKFKSHKKSVVRAKKIGDALIILVVAACSYEIYYKAMEKRAKFDQVSDTKNT